MCGSNKECSPAGAFWIAWMIPADRNPDMITKPKPLLLLQDGLEVLISMTVHWNNDNYIQLLKEKIIKD